MKSYIQMIYKIAAVFLALFIIVSCNDKSQKRDFYSYTKRWDLWRFPLIEPYEIISATNSDDWNLVLKTPKIINADYFNPGDQYEFQLSAIDSAGIEDSIIMIVSRSQYWPKLSGDYKTTLLINTKTNEEFIFSNHHHQKELNLKLKQFGIEKIHQYEFKNIKDDFQLNLKLPPEWNR